MNHTTDHDRQKSLSKQARSEFEKIKDQVCDACGNISDTTKNTINTLQNVYEQSKSNAEDTSKKVIKYTKDHPLKALGFAMLVGFITSKIL